METTKAIDLETLPIKIEYVGKTQKTDGSVDGKPWECFEWRVTLTSKAGYWSTPYYCGMAHVTKPKHSFMEPKPKKPTNADVLYTLTMDASAADENFHDWCNSYGYSDDSIKALNTYKACLEIATALRKHLGRDVVAQIREQLRDH